MVWLPIKSHFQEKVINADYFTILLQKRILVDDAFTIALANKRQVKITSVSQTEKATSSWRDVVIFHSFVLCLFVLYRPLCFKTSYWTRTIHLQSI